MLPLVLMENECNVALEILALFCTGYLNIDSFMEGTLQTKRLASPIPKLCFSTSFVQETPTKVVKFLPQQTICIS